MKTIMLQGTASDVGKSVLCTALCRIFKEDGFRVAPFKSQNMALNSYITRDGGEIGRAQGVQAEACGIEATVDMNPILLKPKQSMTAEVIVHGKRLRDVKAGEYRETYVDQLWPVVEDSLNRLREHYDIVVIEGAGSPAEINLKDRDIVNMKVAELADAPVILAADINRGGVFASLVGTLALLDPHERKRVKGFLINKFRGDLSILQPGLDWLEEYTGIPVLGVIPYVETGVEAEDSLALSSLQLKKQDESPDTLRITVIQLPRISNFTDLDPLYEEPGVRVNVISSVDEWDDPDVIIIPGTKNTTEDLLWLNSRGFSDLIVKAARRGAHVVGICGGYQMLGQTLQDPDGIESEHPCLDGLGLLPIETRYIGDKHTKQVEGTLTGLPIGRGDKIEGYEIHLGRSQLKDGAQPLIELRDGRLDGAVTHNGHIWGTYLHGIFHNRMFTREWLNQIRREKSIPPVAEKVLSEAERREAIYASLASVVREHVNMDKIYEIMGIKDVHHSRA
ncbi:MAG: cobyric acid synthase [Bacillaceae bacterium]|nr:cobyric acid synthase [Bacillaceae bacterium]